MEERGGPPGGSPILAMGSRRGVIGLLMAGLGVLGAAVAALIRPRGTNDGGYRRVVTWKIPGGEGLFVAVASNPGLPELRTLGERLRHEFRDRQNMAVMVFDDATAAREVRRGFRYIGEERFQAALAHQRAMYLKDAARGEHIFTILGHSQEVVHFAQ